MKEFHISNSTYMHSNHSTKKMMMHLFIALMPLALFAWFKNGILPFSVGKVTLYGMLFPLMFIIISMMTTFIIELLYARFVLHKESGGLKEYLSYSYALIPGLILALILPLNTPISILIVGCLAATLIGKLFFGGFGHNIFNPALIGRIFIIATYGAVIAKQGGYLNGMELDAITKATPLTNAGMLDGIGTYQTLVAPFGSLFDFFIGTIPGSIGETSALLCIVAFAYLAFNKVIKWKIPVIYVGTVFLITYMIGAYNGLGIWYPLFQVLSGGLLFGAVFMATDPVTTPTTPIGQVLFGMFLGILTVGFRYLTPMPEGVLTSILTMNMFVIILDKIGSKARFEFKSAMVPFCVAWALMLLLGSFVGQKNIPVTTPGEENKPVVATGFKILSKTKTTNGALYDVTQNGNGGPIRVKITIVGDRITGADVVSHNETPSYYQLLGNYLAVLIGGQSDLEKVDTVSGATISSTAFKKMFINTMKDYRSEFNG